MGTNISIIVGTATDATGHHVSGTFDLFRSSESPVFDVMVDLANDDLAIWGDVDHSNIVWDTITPTMVLGTALNLRTMDHDRVVVVDLDNTDGRHVLRAFTWANGGDQPDLTD